MKKLIFLLVFLATGRCLAQDIDLETITNNEGHEIGTNHRESVQTHKHKHKKKKRKENHK